MTERAMKSYLRLKQDIFAGLYLDRNWPEDWDERELGDALEDWQEELDAALSDRFLTWKNERDTRRAVAAAGIGEW